MQNPPDRSNDHQDEMPALGDLLMPSDITSEPYEIVEDSGRKEKPKRKQKPGVRLPDHFRVYAGAAFIAALTTVIIFGVMGIITSHVSAPEPTQPLPFPTAVPRYDQVSWNWSQPLMTTDTVGGIPPNTLVMISSMDYDSAQQAWFYAVSANGQQANAWEWQLMPPPQPTPTTFPFADAIGMGYLLITTESVGTIPANSRVRISSATPDTQGWLYDIMAEDGGTETKAHAWQLAYAPDVTPGMTPTSPFIGLFGGGGRYSLVIKVQIGDIPADTPVSIGSGYFNGHEWEYSVVSINGQTADHVLQSQLAPLSETMPPTPAPTPTQVTP